MKIFQAALLAAAVTAIKLDDEIPEELAADLKADLGITDADLEALEKLPPKDKKKMIKEAAKGMGEEGLGDDLIKEMGLELADEGEGDKPAGDKKPKKKGPPKEGEEGDFELPPLDELPPPCSEDDDECWDEAEKEMKRILKEEGICSEDDESCQGDAMIMIEEALEGETADGLELGEDKKPKKKGPPKSDGEGDMDLSGLDSEDLPSDLPSDIEGELEEVVFAQDLAEMSEGDLEDLADVCSLDDDSCVEEAVKKMAGGKKEKKKELGEDKKPKKKGPPKSEGDLDDLPSDLDLSDLPSCGSDDECKEMVEEVEKELELGEKKKPKKLGEKKKPKKLGEDKKPKGPKPPKAEGDGVEGEMADAVRQYDADGSGKISAEEGKQLLKDVGFSDDVAGMITEGLGEELDEEPTPEDIVDGVMELASFIAKKEGVAPEDVADAADEVDLSKVTREDVEEFVAYLEEEE